MKLQTALKRVSRYCYQSYDFVPTVLCWLQIRQIFLNIMMYLYSNFIDILRYIDYSLGIFMYFRPSIMTADATNLAESNAKILLQAWRNGDSDARDKLFNLLYLELTQISAAYLRREGGISLSTGDLVNEATLRLLPLEQINWQDKAHFLALAAQTMRRVLIEHSRKKNAHKRAHQRVTLLSNVAGDKNDVFSLCHLDESLLRLQKLDKARADIVEMRYFGGLSLEEISQITGLSVSTVKRSWRVSRAWLLNELELN